jgi:hypothetical protein
MTIVDNASDWTSRNGLYYGHNGRYNSGAADHAMWARVTSQSDYDAVIAAYDWAAALRKNEPFSILDCGCGIGLFPRQLQAAVPVPPVTISYDTLDISPWCLAEHRKRLQPPFLPGRSVNAAIEDIDPSRWPSRYEIIWCIHSLQSVVRARLPQIVQTLTSLLAPDGRCFILLASGRSAYVTLWDLSFEELGRAGEPYVTAEDVAAQLPSQAVETVDCRSDHWVQLPELAPYLNQACMRPDPLTAEEWQRNATFAAFLDSAYSHARNAWCFRQYLTLISFTRC